MEMIDFFWKTSNIYVYMCVCVYIYIYMFNIFHSAAFLSHFLSTVLLKKKRGEVFLQSAWLLFVQRL